MPSNVLTPYIEPNFSLAPSFEKLMENYRQYSYITRYLDDYESIDLQDILIRKTLFVLAEPGQGKTRLLNELARRYDGTSVLIDLKKKAKDESIESLIHRSTNTKDDDSPPQLILLDALDEVSPRDVIETIDHIKTYIIDNPDQKVFISCRIHFFTKYEYSVSGLDQAEFLLIEDLETGQSKKFLQELGVNNATIVKLFASIKFIGRESPTVLHIPRYLEMLAKYIKDNPNNAKKLNRADLFEAFVVGSLNIEDTKSGRQLALYKKRFLEKLALVMEIAQANSISEDELLTFIDEVKSDVKMALINQINVEDLYEHSLLKKTGQEVSFTNAEIQEYLAAKGILRLSDPSQIVFSVAIEPNMREPLPSWQNTLSFIIDEIPGLALKLLNIKSETPTSEDETWHRLVTGSTSPNLIEADKNQIFNRIWNYYYQRKQYMSSEISLRLAGYAADTAIKEVLKDLKNLRLNPIHKEIATNTINLTGNLIALNRVTKTDFDPIKNKLIELALSSSDRVIQHNALNALRNCDDSSLIVKLFKLTASEDDLVLSSLQNLAYDIDKNHPKSVEIFAESIKRGRVSYSKIGIEDITDPKALTVFLKIFSEDRGLIKEIIQHNRIFVKDDQKFLDNLIVYWQPDWLDYLKKFVINSTYIDSGYYSRRSELVANVVKLIALKDKNYFSELIQRSVSEGDKGIHFLFAMDTNIAEIMTSDDTSVIKEVMDTKAHARPFIFRDILANIDRSSSPDASKIATWARNEYPKDYAEHDKLVAKYKKMNDQDKSSSEFAANVIKAQDKDKVVSGNAVLQAMESLERNISDQSTSKNEIKFTEDQIEIIWTKAKEIFLDPFDPAKTELKIKPGKVKDSKSYTITRMNPWFQLAVKFGHATKRSDLATYRTKLINLIPYAYYGEMRAILSELGELSDTEKDLAISAYSDQTSDTALFMPENLVEIAEKFLIKSSVPILDKFIDLDKIPDHTRVKALEVSNLICPDLEKLKRIFIKHKAGVGISRDLALKANELMIINHEDSQATTWRIQYVKDASFQFTKEPSKNSDRAHLVGPLEEELHDGKITKPLKNINDIRYIDSFLDLLNFSFQLIDKGASWYSYAEYIWTTVDQYFTNLVTEQTFTPLDKLENSVASYVNQDSTSAYIRHISSIKRSYLESLGKPKSFAACIQKLNELNTNNYLPITSNKHLYETVSEAITGDLLKWVISEDQKLLLPDDETAAQRHLLLKLDNIFLRKGFTKEEILVLRESQDENDIRTDFLVYYGFYGPVLIELKKSSHQDLGGDNLQAKKSFKSLATYMRQFRAEFGMLLVYETKMRTEDKWKKHLEKIRFAYTNIEGVGVIGLRPPSRTKK